MGPHRADERRQRSGAVTIGRGRRREHRKRARRRKPFGVGALLAGEADRPEFARGAFGDPGPGVHRRPRPRPPRRRSRPRAGARCPDRCRCGSRRRRARRIGRCRRPRSRSGLPRGSARWTGSATPRRPDSGRRWRFRARRLLVRRFAPDGPALRSFGIHQQGGELIGGPGTVVDPTRVGPRQWVRTMLRWFSRAPVLRNR